jgi:hypothetical protein
VSVMDTSFGKAARATRVVGLASGVHWRRQRSAVLDGVVPASRGVTYLKR